MTITTRDNLINALGNNSDTRSFVKTSQSGQAANTYTSLWRGVGIPVQANIPSTLEECNASTPGGIIIPQQTAPVETYLTNSVITGSVVGTLELHDRLMHKGGLNGTTALSYQYVLADLSVAASNISTRKGADDYRDVSWWLEWYTATGASTVNVLVNVIYNDNTSEDLSFSIPSTRPAGHMINLNQYIGFLKSDLGIKQVVSVMLQSSTGTAGNFGVTATRRIATLPVYVVNISVIQDWASLGLPKIEQNACLQGIWFNSGTATGNLFSNLKFAHG